MNGIWRVRLVDGYVALLAVYQLVVGQHGDCQGYGCVNLGFARILAEAGAVRLALLFHGVLKVGS